MQINKALALFVGAVLTRTMFTLPAGSEELSSLEGRSVLLQVEGVSLGEKLEAVRKDLGQPLSVFQGIHGDTGWTMARCQVKFRKGKVISVTGSTLLKNGRKLVQEGQSIDAKLKELGSPRKRSYNWVAYRTTDGWLQLEFNGARKVGAVTLRR